jgi:hypothetical protein
MFVVVWEPKAGGGGGHVAVMDREKADRIWSVLCRQRPYDTVRVLRAEDYGAAAVVERQQRAGYRSTRSR